MLQRNYALHVVQRKPLQTAFCLHFEKLLLFCEKLSQKCSDIRPHGLVFGAYHSIATGEDGVMPGFVFSIQTLDLRCSPSRRPPAHPAVAFRGRRRVESICRDLRSWMLSAPVRAITSTLPLPNGLRAADGKYYWHPDTPTPNPFYIPASPRPSV